MVPVSSPGLSGLKGCKMVVALYCYIAVSHNFIGDGWTGHVGMVV